MGLDMCIFRVKKPILEDRVYTSNEIEKMGYNQVFVDETLDGQEMFKQLLPYTVTREVSCRVINNKKIREDYNLSDDTSINMVSSTGIVFGGKEISMDEINEKYTVTQIKPCYIWNIKDEVAYWRKYYDLQDWIHEVFDFRVQNTGYYMLNAELIHELNETFNENVPAEDPTEDEALFYWEWY